MLYRVIAINTLLSFIKWNIFLYKAVTYLYLYHIVLYTLKVTVHRVFNHHKLPTNKWVGVTSSLNYSCIKKKQSDKLLQCWIKAGYPLFVSCWRWSEYGGYTCITHPIYMFSLNLYPNLAWGLRLWWAEPAPVWELSWFWLELSALKIAIFANANIKLLEVSF